MRLFSLPPLKAFYRLLNHNYFAIIGVSTTKTNALTKEKNMDIPETSDSSPIAPIGQLSLAEWIDVIGVQKLRRHLKVSEGTVRHWRRGFVLPRAFQMVKIVKLAKGTLTYEKIMQDHFSPKNKNRAKMAAGG
jgi:hypothetical protein